MLWTSSTTIELPGMVTMALWIPHWKERESEQETLFPRTWRFMCEWVEWWNHIFWQDGVSMCFPNLRPFQHPTPSHIFWQDGVFLSCLKYVLLKGEATNRQKLGTLPCLDDDTVFCQCPRGLFEAVELFDGFIALSEDLQWTIGKYPTKKDSGATYLGGWTCRTTSWRGDFWSENYGTIWYLQLQRLFDMGQNWASVLQNGSISIFSHLFCWTDDYICQRKHESGSVKSELECKPTRPRLDSDNAMRLVSFKRNSASPIEVLFRRVGRPRTQWTHSTLSLIWKQIRTDGSDITNSADQLQRIERTQLPRVKYKDDCPFALTRLCPGLRS